jgi:hypothetical protein
MRFKSESNENTPQIKLDHSLNLLKYYNLDEKSFKFINNVKLFMNKLFLNKNLPREGVLVDETDLKLFNQLIKKKKIKFKLKNTKSLMEQNLLKIFNQKNAKTRENYLKFIMPKCFKYLKFLFMKNLKNQNFIRPLEMKINIFHDYQFYSFYFSETAKKLGVPIEQFFIFRNWSHRFDQNIPKTVNSHCIYLWKSNPNFIKQIKEYLESDFMADILKINESKIGSILEKWKKLIHINGFEKGSTLIIKSFNKRGLKLPWMVSEIQKAIEVTLKTLN